MIFQVSFHNLIGARPKPVFPNNLNRYYQPPTHDIFNKSHKPIPHGPLTDRGRKHGSPWGVQPGNPLLAGGKPVALTYKQSKFDTSDILGTKSEPAKNVADPKDPLSVIDIEGTTPSKQREGRKNYRTQDYSDIPSKKNPSISTSVYKESKKPLAKVNWESDAMETMKKGYKEIVKEEMNVIRAVGPAAARIIREAKQLRGINRNIGRNILLNKSDEGKVKGNRNLSEIKNKQQPKITVRSNEKEVEEPSINEAKSERKFLRTPNKPKNLENEISPTRVVSKPNESVPYSQYKRVISIEEISGSKDKLPLTQKKSKSKLETISEAKLQKQADTQLDINGDRKSVV